MGPVPSVAAPVFNAEVIRGTAAQSSYALTDRQIRIGRTNAIDFYKLPLDR